MSYTPKHETVLSKKLSAILDKVKTRPQRGEQQTNDQSFRDPRPSPMNWVKDGVDHINIWDHAETDLGKILAHGTTVPFSHSVFGRFKTVEAFWHYISSEEHDDRIRTMRGRTLYEFSKKMTKMHVPNFCAIIIDANWQKIQKYPDVVEAIRQSELPFDCYYRNKRGTGYPLRAPYSAWLVEGFEEIRRAIKENREPNLTRFKDRGDTSEKPWDKFLALMTEKQIDQQALYKANNLADQPSLSSVDLSSVIQNNDDDDNDQASQVVESEATETVEENTQAQ